MWADAAECLPGVLLPIVNSRLLALEQQSSLGQFLWLQGRHGTRLKVCSYRPIGWWAGRVGGPSGMSTCGRMQTLSASLESEWVPGGGPKDGAEFGFLFAPQPKRAEK